jgi:capsular polysaccharide biosynthesis protein/Mrp family chromosome partitioning ATPase
MNSSQRPDSFEPGDYLEVLRRRWWIVLVLAIVGLLAAAAYVKVAPKVYTGTASVQVSPTGANTSGVAGGRTSSGTIDMDSEAQIVQSISVAALAGHTLHSDPTAAQLANLTAAQLGKKISVTVPANSDILQISCNASSPDAAAACANAFASAFLQSQNAAAASQNTAQLKLLEGQVTTLGQSAARLSSKITTLPSNSTERATDLVTLRSDNSQLSALSKQVGQLKGAANSSAGSVIGSATPASTPTSPKALLLLPSGLITGLIIGLIAAFLIDRRDKRIHGARDIERYLDLPVMLSVAAKKHGTQPSLVGPRSRTGQAFAELSHGTSAALGEGNHVLVVAGTSAGPGGGVTAANLAAALARTHSEVALVCADLHGSVIPELFHLGQGRGLAEVLSGNATVSEVARRPADFPRLRVVTPGVDTSFALYNFQHDATRELISELRRSFPFVIIEAQAAGEGGDTFALAEFADAALIAVEVGKARRPEVAECLRRLDRLRTTVLGAVLIPPFSAPGRSKASRQAEPPEQRTTPAERRSRPAERRPEPGARPEPGERRPESGSRPEPASQRPPLKVGMRDPGETWPLPLGAVRIAGDKRGRTPAPATEQSPDKKAGS